MNINELYSQGTMTDPPPVLSSKDLLYMEDMLSWNLNMVKKTHFFASQCQDELVKRALFKACSMHQEHYRELLDHLNHHLNQTAVSQPLKGAQPNAEIQQ
jgi:hypothetical protein